MQSNIFVKFPLLSAPLHKDWALFQDFVYVASLGSPAGRRLTGQHMDRHQVKGPGIHIDPAPLPLLNERPRRLLQAGAVPIINALDILKSLACSRTSTAALAAPKHRANNLRFIGSSAALRVSSVFRSKDSASLGEAACSVCWPGRPECMSVSVLEVSSGRSKFTKFRPGDLKHGFDGQTQQDVFCNLNPLGPTTSGAQSWCRPKPVLSSRANTSTNKQKSTITQEGIICRTLHSCLLDGGVTR